MPLIVPLRSLMSLIFLTLTLQIFSENELQMLDPQGDHLRSCLRAAGADAATTTAIGM